MFKNTYTTRMSGNNRILEKRFEKIKSKPTKLGKLAGIVCTAIVLTVFVLSTAVLANIERGEEYTLDIANNGEVIEFENKPFIENGEVYVPLEEFFTKIGLMENGSEIKCSDEVVLISLKEKNMNKNINADYTSYLYKIEIGKSELVINPAELVPVYTPENAASVAEPMNNAPIKKDSIIYIPYSYIERIIERADNGIQSPPDRYKLSVVYSGEVLSIMYPLESYFRITQSFGKRIHPVTGEESFHNGIDFEAAEGTPVLAGFDGRVIDEGYDNQYGNYVVISNNFGVEILYGHLSRIAMHGAYDVKKGDEIGKSGNTGMSTGPHLHMSVKINGEYVDPQLYLEESRYDMLVMSLGNTIPQALEMSEYKDADYKIVSVKCSNDGEIGFVKLQLYNYDNKIIGVMFDYFDSPVGWSGIVIGENYESFELLFDSGNVETVKKR